MSSSRAYGVWDFSVRDPLGFYNRRGAAEQRIKEGKYALNWTRLPCHRFVANQVRLLLFIPSTSLRTGLAYNYIVSLSNLLGNFVRRLALPEGMKHWSLTSIQTRLIKIGGRLVRHARRLVVSQLKYGAFG